MARKCGVKVGKATKLVVDQDEQLVTIFRLQMVARALEGKSSRGRQGITYHRVVIAKLADEMMSAILHPAYG